MTSPALAALPAARYAAALAGTRARAQTPGDIKRNALFQTPATLLRNAQFFDGAGRAWDRTCIPNTCEGRVGLQ